MNDNGAEQFDRLQAQLQDAHLVIGEQTVALRRFQIAIEQLQAQIKLLENSGSVEEITTSREEGNV